MKYTIHKVGGGYRADEQLLEFLNALPGTTRVISVEAGRYGKWHGLDEENEHGYKLILCDEGVTS